MLTRRGFFGSLVALFVAPKMVTLGRIDPLAHAASLYRADLQATMGWSPIQAFGSAAPIPNRVFWIGEGIFSDGERIDVILPMPDRLVI